MLKEAMEYVMLRGWFVFPCHYMHSRRCSCGKGSGCHSPGKHPMTRHGFKDASNDIVQIKKWWGRWPSANIGIATGCESNIIVVDVDPQHGGKNSLHNILKYDTGEQEKTLIAQSGGHKDGRHYYYLHPGGVIRTVGGVRPGLDIRADNGCIIAPPSIHESGRTYRWLEKNPIAKLPKWVYHLIHEKKISNYLFSRKLRGKKIDVNNIPKIEEGERNNKLFYLCRQMIERDYKQEEAKDLLLAVNETKIKPKVTEGYIDNLVRRLYRRYK